MVSSHFLFREGHGIKCMTCFSRIISEIPEIHTMENCYFLKPIIPELQIREGIADNLKIIFLISQ